MLKNYYVNKISTGNPNYNHEVHSENCPFLPNVLNRIYLGCFFSSTEAINKARLYYSNVDGCAICCPENHKQ